MIKVITDEYREGDNAVKTTSITLLVLFRCKKLTINNKTIALFIIQKI